MIALVVLLTLLLLAVAAVATWLWRSRQALAAQVDRLSAEAGALRSLPPMLGEAAGPRRVITVEITNPLDLARGQGRAAAALSTMTPQLITKIVNDQAARQIAEGLADEGVEADVRVHVSTADSPGDASWRPVGQESIDPVVLGRQAARLGQDLALGLADAVTRAARKATRTEE